MKGHGSTQRFKLHVMLGSCDVVKFGLFECSKFYQKKAPALLYVTDIIGKKSFFESLKPTDKLPIDLAIQTACKAIRSFGKER